MKIPEMNYCMHCGTKLIRRHLDGEGEIPYCPTCGEFRFPVFNTAVSMIVLNQAKDRILMIRQYGGDEYILVAGYVNKGEDAEDAVKREVSEEMGLNVCGMSFNRSHYYAPSNTLMLNYAVTVSGEEHNNSEVDSWAWFTFEEARERIRKNSLAKAFLLGWLDGVFVFPDKPAEPYRSVSV